MLSSAFAYLNRTILHCFASSRRRLPTINFNTIIIKDKKTHKEGFMKDGKIIVPAVHDSIVFVTSVSLSEGVYAYCKSGIKYMFNSNTGKVIADGNRYDEVGRTRNGTVFKVIKDGKVGLIDAETGKVIAPAVFGDYLCYGRGFHILGKSANGTGTMSVFDKNGVLKGTMDLNSSTQREQIRFMTDWCGSAMLIETSEQYKDRGYRMASLKKITVPHGCDTRVKKVLQPQNQENRLRRMDVAYFLQVARHE